ncbi:MAG: putative manganese-dependent inorganic diphosphatase [Oscillospiraceae bacterium]|nr:putative manganese-dependent inorganic diphosphatase [Oscillospiraceae bacterium]
MEPIYVTGHRNPDTDSIVAALSYTALRNAIGEREYEAACLGHIPDDTMRVLNRFGFQPPKRIYDVYTQIKDLEYDTPPVLSAGVTVGRAWTVLQGQKNVSSLPVANEDGTLYGMLSWDDMASYHMGLVSSAYLRPVPVFNLLSVLEGRLLNDVGSGSDMISGEVTIALPQSRENLMFRKADSIVLCGDQPDMIRRALELGVNCLIICQAEVGQELLEADCRTSIIVTPYDAYRALRLIFQSAPVGRVCRSKHLTAFHLEDRVDDVRDVVLKKQEHCYPILDSREQVVGILTRQHLLRPRRKRVVLVDHNEAAQSVPGLEEAEILEIIDHHRLADIQTTNPIYVRNEPVGSTNTIIAGMFQERGLMPSERMAGLMAAAIVSDTVMFKSPTCTDRDKKMAERMARVAGVSLEELGREIFSTAPLGKDPREMLLSDYKEFHIAGYNLAVAQITCVDSKGLLERKAEFLAEMEAIARNRNFAMVLLMITDVLMEGTHLLYVGDDDVIRQAFSVTPKDNYAFLSRIMSRKKQIIPSLSALWG